MSQQTLQTRRSSRSLANLPPSLRVASNMLRNHVTNSLIKGLVDNDTAVKFYEAIDELAAKIAWSHQDHVDSEATRGRA